MLLSREQKCVLGKLLNDFSFFKFKKSYKLTKPSNYTDPLEYCHIVFSNENRVDFDRYVTRNNNGFYLREKNVPPMSKF